jgi:hypothetical protein
VKLAQARVAKALGDAGRAVELLREAVAILDRVQARGHRSVVMASLARALAATGAFAEAHEAVHQSLTAARGPEGATNVSGVVQAHLAGAEVALREEKPGAAAPHAARAWQFAAQAHLHALEVRALALNLLTARMRGDATLMANYRQRGRLRVEQLLIGMDETTRRAYRARPEVRALLD